MSGQQAVYISAAETVWWNGSEIGVAAEVSVQQPQGKHRKELEFRSKTIQVDNGPEFVNDYEQTG